MAPAALAGDPNAKRCIEFSERGLSRKNAGALLAARDNFLTCAATVCPADVRAECAHQVTELNRAIPSIVFEIRDPDGNDLTAVKITMDRKTLVEEVTGKALTIDPGEHVFVFEVAGEPKVEKTLVLREGEQDRRERIVIGRRAEEPKHTTPRHPSGQRTAGLVVGGIGLVGVGVGTYFGLRASSLWSRSQNECSSPTSCADHGQAVSDHDGAKTAATISTIAFIAGGAALATGSFLFFTAPSVGPDHAALHVGGVF